MGIGGEEVRWEFEGDGITRAVAICTPPPESPSVRRLVKNLERYLDIKGLSLSIPGPESRPLQAGFFVNRPMPR